MCADFPTPDLVLINGKIITLDNKTTIAEALAVYEGKILLVGSSREINQLVDAKTPCIDLKGKSVLPGFIDAHTHVDLVGIMTSELVVDCHIPPLGSVSDILDKIRERTLTTPKGELIIGQGRWAQPYPTKKQLDQVAPNHPVLIKNTMHSYYLNSLALNRFNITKGRPTLKELFEADPCGIIYRDPKTGEPTGFVDEAWNYLFPQSHSPFPYEQTRSAIKEGLNKYSSLGVTTITELVDFFESSMIYQDLRRNGELNIRLQIIPCIHGLQKTADFDSIIGLGLTTGFGDEWIKFGGIKIFVDRGIETSLASIQLKEWVMKAHRHSIRVLMHANTRKGQDMALEAIEAAVEDMPEQNLRHRIEHMGNRLIDINYFDRVKKSGSIALPTAYFMNIGRTFQEGQKIFLFRTMLDKGLCVPGNSDTGGTEPEAPNPLYQIQCMVERKDREGNPVYPEERITVEEALKLYTRHSAFACLEENIKGSIEPGRLADLAVLEKNPLTSPENQLKEIQVYMTIVNGKIVYQRSD